jgi:anti-anti-sigma regulatory factor
MALTMRPPTTDTVRSVGSALMSPEVRVEGARIVIVLRTGTDVSTRPVLCDVLSRVIAVGAGDVVIDLAEAKFIDTATGRVLATARQLLDDQDRRLTFRSAARLAGPVLHFFGLADLIEAETLR